MATTPSDRKRSEWSLEARSMRSPGNTANPRDADTRVWFRSAPGWFRRDASTESAERTRLPYLVKGQGLRVWGLDLGFRV